MRRVVNQKFLVREDVCIVSMRVLKIQVIDDVYNIFEIKEFN